MDKVALILHLFYKTFNDARATPGDVGQQRTFPVVFKPASLPDHPRRGAAMLLQTGNLFSAEGRRGGDER
ncbi:hypothetical protein M3181_25795, partial [Mesobacillus maritimus]